MLREPSDRLEISNPSYGSASFTEFIKVAPQGDIDLLADLSLLDSFTREEASKISKHPDSSKRLDQLEKKRIISLITEMPKRYQINSLVHEDFRALLANDPVRFKKVALKSARVLETKFPLKALELFGLAGDIEAATAHVMTHFQHFLLQADMELVLKWAPVISMALGGGKNREKMVKAYGLLAAGKFEQVNSTLREIETNLSSNAEAMLINNELEPIRQYLNFAFGHFNRVFESSKSAKTRGGEFYLRHRIVLSSYFYLQESEEYQKYFNSIEINPKEPASEIDLVYLNSLKAMHSFLIGNYIDASEYALAACQLAEDLGAEGSYFPFESAYILMDTHLEFGNADKSQSYVERYLPKAIRFHQHPWIAAFHAKAALIKSQAGNLDAALSLIGKGREAVESPLFGADINFILDSHELVMRIPLGDMERIGELLYRLAETQAVSAFKSALEVMRNPQQAERIAKSMPDKTAQDKFRRDLLLATALINNKEKAAKYLRSAIELAVPNGYFRAFLNLPPQVKDLVLDLAIATPTTYLENLARAIRNQSNMAASSLSSMNKPLTKRELSILRRLDSGLAITQIADSLSITKNTIKTHLKSIYRKLEVESRDEAVEQAKKLLLL